jgi:hypothetical protein
MEPNKFFRMYKVVMESNAGELMGILVLVL